jgi:hypothetical protein
MSARVLILGGYGNFGKRIAESLVEKRIPVIIAGRDERKAVACCESLATGLADYSAFDAKSSLGEYLEKLQPAVVINACGPYQDSDYTIAERCIDSGVHYIDLADGRDFVNGITLLDQRAREKNVAVISGASTVPCLASAVIEHYRPRFSEIDFLKYGISPGQQAERGLATTRAIMTYVGKPLSPFPGIASVVYGWQDIYRQSYPEIGNRWMANCDIPDLDLFPQYYGIRKLQFSASLELSLPHLGLWLLSWLVRAGVPLNLPKLASSLLTVSDWLNGFGSADGGMHMIFEGKDRQGLPMKREWFIIAKDGYGPYIPTVPAVILAGKLINGQLRKTGAFPCVGLITLEEYLGGLKGKAINIAEY